MRFPLLTTFMHGGGSAGGGKGGAKKLEQTDGGDPDQVATRGIEMDARQAALARLGLGGDLSWPSKAHATIKDTSRLHAPVTLRNTYTSVLPTGMIDFAAQYPLTTVAGIGAVATTVLITSSALTSLALRRLLRGPPARKVDIEGQMADMERRLAHEIVGMRAEMRRLQIDSLGGQRRGSADASFQRVVMTRLDRLDQTLSEMTRRIAQAPPEALPGSTPATEDVMVEANEGREQASTLSEGLARDSASEMPNADDARSMEATKTERKRKSATKKAGQGSSVDTPSEGQTLAEGGDEPIMSFADIAQAIKGVQADYASYAAPERESIVGASVESFGGSNTAEDIGAATELGDEGTAGPEPSSVAGTPLPDLVKAEQPSITRATPVDRIEAELASAVYAEMPLAAALDTNVAQVVARTNSAESDSRAEAPEQPTSAEVQDTTRSHSSPDPVEPRPVDHSQPLHQPEQAAEPRPPGHGSDILYGKDDSGCWHVTIPPGDRRRGWHWLRTSISFNANDWSEGVGPSYYVSKRSRYTETKPSAIHRVHYNSHPCLIELDHQIWQIAREGKQWVIHGKLGKA